MSTWYNPAAFRVDDAALLGACIDRLMFATLLSNGPDGPLASHLPMLLDRQAGPPGRLRGHLARANAHAARLEGEPVLVQFQGPAHYVSPSWYPSKRRSARVVPTWNYVVVQARGRVSLREERTWLLDLVTTLTERLERNRVDPWAVGDAPADYLDRMLEQIVGVEIAVEQLEGKFKLGQNRSAEDQAGLADGLAAELPELAAALAALNAPPSDP